MNLKNAQDIIKQQLAWEYNCDPKDFSELQNVITTSILHEKRRMFNDKPNFFKMVTFGQNAVISLDPSIYQWVAYKWEFAMPGTWLFEQHRYFELEKKLREYGHKMQKTYHMFMPKPELMNIKTDLKLKWMEQEEIAEFEDKDEYCCALCGDEEPKRVDMLAVMALDGDKIMGMAGCSADSELMWQIGIEVNPDYQRSGVAKTLVSLMRDEIFRRGAVPYYATTISNIKSWKTALASGFELGWIEAESRAEDEAI